MGHSGVHTPCVCCWAIPQERNRRHMGLEVFIGWLAHLPLLPSGGWETRSENGGREERKGKIDRQTDFTGHISKSCLGRDQKVLFFTTLECKQIAPGERHLNLSRGMCYLWLLRCVYYSFVLELYWPVLSAVNAWTVQKCENVFGELSSNTCQFFFSLPQVWIWMESQGLPSMLLIYNEKGQDKWES